LLFERERDDRFGDPPELLWPAVPPKNRWPLEVDEPSGLSPKL
jgi:hypothetical protein